ncbi:transcriptional regulator, LuxR family [Catenulispora acidiphila DSM 44928]|uniref:Transcriptional regulator, LuxR family n=2 Tax=Catenulispora TaxID=414878 RepID=C7QCK0_CATAD|nr:transcriptional regulator, LuxR family [Catenulispora acidiphila DSM 44928]
MLGSLGLDPLAQAVYSAMLADPAVGVRELKERLGQEEARIRDTLDRLVELALLRPSREQPGGLYPVSLVAGMQLLVQRQEAELAAGRDAVAAGRAAAADRQRAEQLFGLDAVQSELEQLLAGAAVEVLSMVPGSAVPAATLKAAESLDQDMTRRVRSRILYHSTVRQDPTTIAYGRWMAEQGSEVRLSPSVTRRLLIVDGKTAVVPIKPNEASVGALCVREPGLIDQLTALFELIWTEAVPLGMPAKAESPAGLSPTDRHLLRLLADGLTDEAAAKRLGISARTVRRIMADLMDRLGAESRFEAGVEAARRGWL